MWLSGDRILLGRLSASDKHRHGSFSRPCSQALVWGLWTVGSILLNGIKLGKNVYNSMEQKLPRAGLENVSHQYKEFINNKMFCVVIWVLANGTKTSANIYGTHRCIKNSVNFWSCFIIFTSLTGKKKVREETFHTLMFVIPAPLLSYTSITILFMGTQHTESQCFKLCSTPIHISEQQQKILRSSQIAFTLFLF